MAHFFRKALHIGCHAIAAACLLMAIAVAGLCLYSYRQPLFRLHHEPVVDVVIVHYFGRKHLIRSGELTLEIKDGQLKRVFRGSFGPDLSLEGELGVTERTPHVSEQSYSIQWGNSMPVQHVGYPPLREWLYWSYINFPQPDFSLWWLTLPFITPALLWYALLLARRYDRRRLTLAGHCPRCRYNLTGSVSPTCPECGTPRPIDTNLSEPGPAALS